VDTASEELVVTRTQLAGSPSGGNDCAIDEEDYEEYSFCGGGSDEEDNMNDVKVVPAKKSRGGTTKVDTGAGAWLWATEDATCPRQWAARRPCP
jgi:hypothetical protein